MHKQELIRLALEAREHSYAPYSGFQVGAAILCGSGKVYQGCNVENASYGATVCAERTAALKAVYDGEKVFKAVAVAGFSANGQSVFAFPCGICRQFLREFAANPMHVYVSGSCGEILETTLDELLPNAFGPETLEGEGS